jgi:hypothetical protein
MPLVNTAGEIVGLDTFILSQSLRESYSLQHVRTCLSACPSPLALGFPSGESQGSWAVICHENSHKPQRQAPLSLMLSPTCRAGWRLRTADP